jgi:hypothetical protein
MGDLMELLAQCRRWRWTDRKRPGDLSEHHRYPCERNYQCEIFINENSRYIGRESKDRSGAPRQRRIPENHHWSTLRDIRTIARTLRYKISAIHEVGHAQRNCDSELLTTKAHDVIMATPGCLCSLPPASTRHGQVAA